MNNMNVVSIFTLIFLSIATLSNAQTVSEKQLAYSQVLGQRADKILGTLDLTDSLKYIKVRKIVVGHYQDMNKVHEEKASKVNSGKVVWENEKVKQENMKLIEEAAAQNLQTLHHAFLSKLSAELTESQVDLVKDGMTYGVLPITYKAYQDMIPSLKDAEKKRILDWLTEARELAMDAGSSESKHAVFGKYKGRVNNYLSAQGYDLQAERKAWEERIRVGRGR